MADDDGVADVDTEILGGLGRERDAGAVAEKVPSGVLGVQPAAAGSKVVEHPVDALAADSSCTASWFCARALPVSGSRTMSRTARPPTRS